MDKSSYRPDPIHRLRELQQWLVENEVKKVPNKAKSVLNTSWIHEANPEARRELHEFDSWVKEIQAQPRTTITLNF